MPPRRGLAGVWCAGYKDTAPDGAGRHQRRAVLKTVLKEFPVKKILKSRSCNILSIILHREDLIDLMGLLGTLGTSLQIHDGEYEYSSMEELIQNHKNSISDLHIFNNEANIDFHYTRQLGVTFVCPVNKSEEEALFLRTREFLNQRFNRWNYLLDVRVWSAIFLLNALLWVFLQKSNPSDFVPLWALIPLPILIFSITPLRGFLLNLVTTNGRNERSLFWKNNKDKIFLALISALIGAAITWLFSKLK
jgi:hypothetical protein